MQSALADSPQLGGTPARNNAPAGDGAPVKWEIGNIDSETGAWDRAGSKNIRLVARLGSYSYGSPVVAGGKVFCATNNAAAYLKRYPRNVDLGCVLAFSQADGKFLWQFSCEKHPKGRMVDWPEQGICSTPLVEGERLWVVTNRGEVVCLATGEKASGGQTKASGGRIEANGGRQPPEQPADQPLEPELLWRFDMMRELGSVQRNMASCSVTAAGDLLLVGTSNARDDDGLPAPQAPSFIALDKNAGKLVWADASPGENILHGQWGSPAFAVLGGVPQAIFPGGDGWLYSFLAEPTADTKAKLLWKFDCNLKTVRYKPNGRGDRNELVSTPVIAEGRVYIATGQDPEYGEGPGILWCIDPTKRGDVSRDIVVDKDGKPVPPRRVIAVDAEAGEKVQPNPNSACLWCYTGEDLNGDGKLDFNETMHRSISMPVVKDGLLVIPDLPGTIHCLDAKTGKPHWTHDMLASVWGSPLVADGKVYIGDEEGKLFVFKHAAKKQLLAENNVGSPVYTSPVFANGVLWIATKTHLVAIQASGGR